MSHLSKFFGAILLLNVFVGCSAQPQYLPLMGRPAVQTFQPQAPLQTQARIQRFSTNNQIQTLKYTLALSEAELAQLEDDFMLNLNLSSDLMGLYFSNPQFKSVYTNTFVGTVGFKSRKSVALSFDVFDLPAFEAQALPQIRSLVEVNGRKLIRN